MSLIKAIKAQLGLSVTSANNFTLDASADGGATPLKLTRNDGVDILTVDAAGKVEFPQNFDRLVGIAIFDGTTIGTHALLSGFGITSVIRNAIGNYTLNLSTTYSDNLHVVTCLSDAAAVQAPQWVSATTSSITIANYNSAGSPTDAVRIFVTIHRAAP